MTIHPVVAPEEWNAARKALLKAEKEHTRLKDRVSAQRRELPWVRIDKQYVFQRDEGPVCFSELFQGRSQLVVQHFMFDPEWDEGCVGCSFLADHVDDAFQHIYHHDVAFVAISRAPYLKLATFKERMGWRFNWVSSHRNDFNCDFGVSVTQEDIESGRQLYYGFEPYETDEPGEMPGTSVFFKDEDGTIYHTYSTFGMGDEQLINAYNYLDIAPLGRNEPAEAMDWIHHHDRYPAS